MSDRYERIRAAPQQPAAVDEAAAIRAFEEHFEASAEDPSLEGELELWLTAWRKALDSAPQQPVAVDVAAAKRAVAAVMSSAPDGISVEAFFRIVLEAAVAGQRQEPTTCKHDFRRDEDHGGACCQLCGEVRQ